MRSNLWKSYGFLAFWSVRGVVCFEHLASVGYSLLTFLGTCQKASTNPNWNRQSRDGLDLLCSRSYRSYFPPLRLGRTVSCIGRKVFPSVSAFAFPQFPFICHPKAFHPAGVEVDQQLSPRDVRFVFRARPQVSCYVFFPTCFSLIFRFNFRSAPDGT